MSLWDSKLSRCINMKYRYCLAGKIREFSVLLTSCNSCMYFISYRITRREKGWSGHLRWAIWIIFCSQLRAEKNPQKTPSLGEKRCIEWWNAYNLRYSKLFLKSMELCIWIFGGVVRFYSFYHMKNGSKLLKKIISERQKTGIKTEPLLETCSLPGGNGTLKILCLHE